MRLDGHAPWTWSANPGEAVYGETLRKAKHGEWRRWDPRRSKVASGLLRTSGAPERLLPSAGDHVLYLGAGHGTTVSHIHDVVCHGGAPGRVVAVDLSPRCLRDLTRLSHARPGLVPVLGMRGGLKHGARGCPDVRLGCFRTWHKPIKPRSSPRPVSAFWHRVGKVCFR